MYNLGSEAGFSVREVIKRAKVLTGIDFAVREKERRAGYPAILVASSERIRRELGWEPAFSKLDTMISTSWRWHNENPRGFGEVYFGARGYRCGTFYLITLLNSHI